MREAVSGVAGSWARTAKVLRAPNGNRLQEELVQRIPLAKKPNLKVQMLKLKLVLL